MSAPVRVTILGCGGSLGLPHLTGNWGAADASNPKNQRTRASILVETAGRLFLIDTSPDLRQQYLRQKESRAPDAVLYTHTHADHCHGIDDLRAFYFRDKNPIPVYSDTSILDDLKNRFAYMFNGFGDKSFYKPIVTAHTLQIGWNDILGIPVGVLWQEHGPSHSLGYRFGDFAYSTDMRVLPPESLNMLRGIKTWVVGVSDWFDRAHPTHAGLSEIIAYAQEIGVQNVYLTHLNPGADYADLRNRCPENMQPCYDGLVIEC